MPALPVRRERAPSRTARARPEPTTAHDAAPGTGAIIRSADDVVQHLTHLASAEQEHLWCLGLNARHRVLCSLCVALGTVDRVQVVGRDVFRPLIRANCAAFIIAHNHPSGEPAPSAQDGELTVRLEQSGTLLGITLLDHIVIAAGGHYSYAEHGLLTPERRRWPMPPLPPHERLRLTYVELLDQALTERPAEEVRALLSALICTYYPGGDAEAPRSGAAVLAAVGHLVTPFHPDTLGYLPESLLKGMGVELAAWFEEALGRTPTTTELVKLYVRLPKLGIREAIHQTCLTWDRDAAVDEGAPGTGAKGPDR